jgi:hypothetical protein
MKHIDAQTPAQCNADVTDREPQHREKPTDAERHAEDNVMKRKCV